MHYPHRVEVRRAESTGVEDDEGRDVLGDPATIHTVGAWVQAKTARERTLLTEGGPVRSDHTVFLWPRDEDGDEVSIREGDEIHTLAGGGQDAGTVHQIIAINDPDGMRHHYEVDTLVVKPIVVPDLES